MSKKKGDLLEEKIILAWCVMLMKSTQGYNILYELVSRCYDMNYRYKETSELADLRRNGSAS